MKKENRILKNSDFAKIIKIGKRHHTNLMTFYFLKNTNQTYRIGICVSKKVSKLAVTRNLIKRRIIAILNDKYNTRNFYDIVIIAKNDCTNCSFQMMEQDVESFLKKIIERRQYG